MIFCMSEFAEIIRFYNRQLVDLKLTVYSFMGVFLFKKQM